MQLALLNVVDWLIIIVIVLSMLVGLFRGLVHEVLSLLAWVLAGYISFILTSKSLTLLPGSVHQPQVRYAICFTIIFIISIIILSLVRYMICKLFNKLPLRTVDRLLGLAFGLLRGVLILSIIFFMLSLVPLATEQAWYKESQLRPAFSGIVVWLKDVLPDEYQQHLQHTLSLPKHHEMLKHIEQHKGESDQQKLDDMMQVLTPDAKHKSTAQTLHISKDQVTSQHRKPDR